MDREKRLTVGSRQVIVPKSFGFLSPTSSTGSPAIAVLVSTVAATTLADMAVSPPMPAQRVQIPPANSPAVLPLQLDTLKDDPFVREVHSTSVVSVTTPPGATTVVAEARATRELDREPSA